MSDPLLSIRDLSVQFDSEAGLVRAVDQISFDVYRGETVCVVGESGSGKTVSCESITRLVEGDVEGSILFEGTDLLALPEPQLRNYRGKKVAYVFQNPQNTLDPVYTVGQQLAETVQSHAEEELERSEARDRAISILERVGIPDPGDRADDYPHEFSGGMKQRVAIARALAGDPDLLVADEPTTALDVTIEAQILDLLSELQAERDMAVLYVTHDMGVVAEIADRVIVMYGGKVMEAGPIRSVFNDPAHPYTRALLRSLPEGEGLPDPIGGSPPDPTNLPAGCRFHPRCDHAIEECRIGDHPNEYSVTTEDRSVYSNQSPVPQNQQSRRRVSCVHYDGADTTTEALGDQKQSTGSAKDRVDDSTG